MPLMFALVGVPPRVATAFVQIDEDVGAGVTPCEGDLGLFDGLHVLVGAGLGFGVVVSSHFLLCSFVCLYVCLLAWRTTAGSAAAV